MTLNGLRRAARMTDGIHLETQVDHGVVVKHATAVKHWGVRNRETSESVHADLETDKDACGSVGWERQEESVLFCSSLPRQGMKSLYSPSVCVTRNHVV